MRSMVHALRHDSLYPGQCITLNLAGCNNSRTYIHQLEVRQYYDDRLVYLCFLTKYHVGTRNSRILTQFAGTI
jgi:hypothetical protein